MCKKCKKKFKTMSFCQIKTLATAIDNRLSLVILVQFSCNIMLANIYKNSCLHWHLCIQYCKYWYSGPTFLFPPLKKISWCRKEFFFFSPKFILQRIFLNYFVIFQYNSIAKFWIKHCFEHLGGYDMSRRMTKPTKWPVRPVKTDQTGHPSSLIRVFDVCSLGS